MFSSGFTVKVMLASCFLLFCSWEEFVKDWHQLSIYTVEFTSKAIWEWDFLIGKFLNTNANCYYRPARQGSWWPFPFSSFIVLKITTECAWNAILDKKELARTA
jgi:hypothetical protein